jgi:cellulose synthase/poly-beta-1,6-N-acetylglucosamine synthase-like glycosyltransferase
MSGLRIAGLLIGIAGLIFTFLVYRGPKWKRLNFILFSLFNLALIAVTINPNVVNFARDLLSLEEYQYSRLIALLIISNIFIMFFLFYTTSKLEKYRLQFDRLVRSLGAEEINGDTALHGHIKPIMVVIPAYNEADNLKELLPRVPSQVNGVDIGALVIDDGSDDNSFEVASGREGVWAVRSLINRGGGAALRLGYDILKQAGVDICVTMDADGQHDPAEINVLVEPLLENQCDCVIGSRILGTREKGSKVRIVGVHVFGALISTLLGKKITDPSSGFRAFRMKPLSEIQLHEDQYHTSELIIEAVKKGLSIKEVPITILKRKHGISKKGRDFIYGFHFTRIIVKTWWR